MILNEPADQERYEALAAAGWYDDDAIGRIVASIEAVHDEEHEGTFAECPDLACQLAVAVEKQAAVLNATATAPAPDSDRLPPPATELDTRDARCHGDAAERCPFCDGVAVVWSLLRDGYATTPDDPDARAYWCRCRACGCNGGWAKSEGGARRWWSMRSFNAPSPAPDLAALREKEGTP